MKRIFPTILALITQQDRYFPEIEWSEKSWTHNVFRFYEMIFGRTTEVRAEISSIVKVEKGKIVQITYYAHSFEGMFALVEQQVREFFASLKWKPFRIYIPQLVTPQGFTMPQSPFLFAIAYDTYSAAAWVSSGTTVTYSHTNTGSNRVLVTGGYINSNGGADTTSAWSYNSVSMTRNANGAAYNGTDYWYVYALSAPATGANNAAMTQSSSFNSELFAMSFSGANQSSTIDSAAVSAGSASQGSPFSMTTTVVNANSMLIGGGRTDGTPAASTNTTLAYNSFTFIAYSTTTVGTGSQSTVVTGTTGRMFGYFVASVAPAVASGPANLKSRSGNLKANIKSASGNLIANMKSLSGNS